MANLYEILADAQRGQALAGLSREFGLTPEQTQSAVAALLPAISVGLKRATATPEGLGNLFALMAQPNLHGAYDDPRAAFSPEASAAGNAALSTIFGSPDASRAITAQAQNLSGVTSAILKKLLPIVAGLIISGLMRSGSGQAAPQTPQSSPDHGGQLIDILRQIFGQGLPGASEPTSAEPSESPTSSKGGGLGRELGPGSGYRIPETKRQPVPIPTDASDEPTPDGDVLGQILRELGKAIQEGRLKPVVVGPYEIDIPKQAGPAGSGQPQIPGGDVLGQILRDLLSGKGGQVQVPSPAPGSSLGSLVFGNRIEPGREVEQSQLDSFEQVLDQFLGAQRR